MPNAYLHKTERNLLSIDRDKADVLARRNSLEFRRHSRESSPVNDV